MMSIDDLVRTVMEELHTIVKTETVIGEPVEVGESTILVPVCRISFGFGVGGHGSMETKGSSGTGGGASVEPIAFLVIKDGKPQLLPFQERKAVSLGKVVELVPDLLEKVKDFKAKRDDKGKDRKEEKKDEKQD
jgi:sporulation protein YtfJ